MMISSGKRKRDEYPGQLPSGSFVTQQDGSADQTVQFVVSKVFFFIEFAISYVLCFLKLFSVRNLVAQRRICFWNSTRSHLMKKRSAFLLSNIQPSFIKCMY